MKNRILYLDIETTPNKGYCWGSWEQNIIAFEKEYDLLCFAYKWDGGKTKCLGLNDFKGSNLKLVKELRNLLDECEICCGHNVDRFDIRMANTFFLKYGLTPPSPYKTIDTLKIARRRFRFNSNRLTDLGMFLGLGKKKETGGFQLWLDCINGDKKAWKRMKAYNKNDVVLLEKIYLKLRPWITGTFNINVGKKLLCPVCGSNNYQNRGWTMNTKFKVKRHQCQKCGHWFLGEKVKL